MSNPLTSVTGVVEAEIHNPEAECPQSGEQIQPPFGIARNAPSPSNGETAAVTKQPIQQCSEETRTILEVAAYGCTVWLRMSNWGKVNDTLEPRERSLAYSVGRRLREGNLPSFRQARWAKAIMAKVMESGFDTTAIE